MKDNLDERKIREIVQDEIQRNYRSGSPFIPPHRHNGKDNLQVNLSDVIGTNPIVYSANKVETNFFYPDYSYASSEILGADQIILNNYTSALDSNSVPNKLLTTTPIPVIYGAINTLFRGGNAEVGTMVAFQGESSIDGPIYQLWIMLLDGWYGISLASTADIVKYFDN